VPRLGARKQAFAPGPTINCLAQAIALTSSSSVRSIRAMTARSFSRFRTDIVASGAPVRPRLSDQLNPC
jgi:hypothetical protein